MTSSSGPGRPTAAAVDDLSQLDGKIARCSTRSVRSPRFVGFDRVRTEIGQHPIVHMLTTFAGGGRMQMMSAVDMARSQLHRWLPRSEPSDARPPHGLLQRDGTLSDGRKRPDLIEERALDPGSQGVRRSTAAEASAPEQRKKIDQDHRVVGR